MRLGDFVLLIGNLQPLTQGILLRLKFIARPRQLSCRFANRSAPTIPDGNRKHHTDFRGTQIRVFVHTGLQGQAGQTLGALRDRDHPYRQALTAEVGAVTVVDLDGALALTETTLDTETVVIVSTMQSFKREDPTSLRVFAENGDFLRPLASVPRTGPFAEGFDRYDDGRVVPSLANVLRARRPVVIMDEAHNERTPLSFGTLARLAPSCIVEFTATPDHTDTPSNVLVQASASELKAEQMIRLPISLTIRPLWQDVVTAALQVRSRLEEEARREEADGGRYIRPILLVQAEARS